MTWNIHWISRRHFCKSSRWWHQRKLIVKSSASIKTNKASNNLKMAQLRTGALWLTDKKTTIASRNPGWAWAPNNFASQWASTDSILRSHLAHNPWPSSCKISKKWLLLCQKTPISKCIKWCLGMNRTTAKSRFFSSANHDRTSLRERLTRPTKRANRSLILTRRRSDWKNWSLQKWLSWR